MPKPRLQGPAAPPSAVLQRDGKCRILGCDIRGPLEVHHLLPRAWGGTDELSNLASVCVAGGRHHPILAQDRPAMAAPPRVRCPLPPRRGSPPGGTPSMTAVVALANENPLSVS